MYRPVIALQDCVSDPEMQCLGWHWCANQLCQRTIRGSSCSFVATADEFTIDEHPGHAPAACHAGDDVLDGIALLVAVQLHTRQVRP